MRQNSQRPGDPVPVLRILNAGEAEAQGFELEFEARPTKWLNVWGNYAYLNTEYIELIDSTGVDRSGNPLPFSPEQSFLIGGEIRQPFGEGMEGFARAEYNWQDEYFDDAAAAPVNLEEAYGLLSGSIGIDFSDRGLTVEVWGKNLNDELYRTHSIPFLGDRFVVYGAPRTYGVRLRLQTW